MAKKKSKRQEILGDSLLKKEMARTLTESGYISLAKHFDPLFVDTDKEVAVKFTEREAWVLNSLVEEKIKRYDVYEEKMDNEQKEMRNLCSSVAKKIFSKLIS